MRGGRSCWHGSIFLPETYIYPLHYTILQAAQIPRGVPMTSLLMCALERECYCIPKSHKALYDLPIVAKSLCLCQVLASHRGLMLGGFQGQLRVPLLLISGKSAKTAALNIVLSMEPGRVGDDGLLPSNSIEPHEWAIHI